MAYRKKNGQTLITLSISLIIVTLLFCTCISIANYAYAHSLPVTETPASNSITKKGAPLPSKITIDFSERPDPNVSTIQVINSKNERIDDGKFTIIGDHDREAQTGLNIKKLADGVYTVSWMTQSVDDGHIARGSYVFGVGNVGPGSTTQGSSSTNTLQNNPRQSVQTVAVTSNLDGLIKWPLIVSEVAIVGGIFSHFFLWEKFGTRIGVKSIKGMVIESETKSNRTTTTIPWAKRFSLVLVIASATIIACVTSLLFLQITELAANSNSNYRSIFESVLRSSSGISWLIHIVTASVILICILANYSILRKYRVHKPLKKNRSLSSQSVLLWFAFAAGAVCIFANSMTSHNAAANFIPSLAVFIDWVHLMAVSLWIGGLFYISVILLNSLKNSDTLKRPPALFAANEEKNIQQELQDDKTGIKDSSNKISATTYYLALLLPRFSLIATISLGAIGISGIYMAWIQLHSFNELFYSTYGNVLIIKLAIALPIVLLGTYHQIRIHNFISVIANMGRTGAINSFESSKNKNSFSSKHLEQDIKNKDNRLIQKFASIVDRNKTNNQDLTGFIDKGTVFPRFGFTIKIESLLAVFLLLVASMLTITSPNSMMSMASSMPGMSNMPNMPPASTTSSSSQMVMSGNQMQMKNSTLVKQANIMNVNTKVEINPFHSGFNNFKITFTDASGKPYTKVNSAELTFKNDKADIGPIVVSMKKIQPNVFAVGTFIGLPGEWNIAMAAQRQADYDLNYDFTSKVTNAPSAASASSPSSNAKMKMGSSIGTNNNLGNSQNQEPMPKFDSFAILAIVLSVILGIISWYTYQRSKQDLKMAVDRFEGGN